jgi:hypothetical protein
MNWKRFHRGARPRAPAASRPQLEPLKSPIVPSTTSGNAWPSPQLITLSFVPDGTVIGATAAGYITSNLDAAFNNKFGSASAWHNTILPAAKTWAQPTNLTFSVVASSGATIGSGPDQQGNPNAGDVRVSGSRAKPPGRRPGRPLRGMRTPRRLRSTPPRET